MDLAVQGGATPRAHLHRVADASIDYFRVRPDFYRVFQRELGGATWARRKGGVRQGVSTVAGQDQ